MIKTAIIGASGYIGQHLFRHYRKTFHDCIGTTFSKSHAELFPFDLCHPKTHALKLQETHHEALIIASAKPNIAWCEMNPKESYELNVIGTLELIRQVEKMGIHIIFFSSDYVFDGKEGAYADSDTTNPSTQYGRQKAEVEREIRNLTENFTILRLSKIYGTTWKDNTLIDEIAANLCAGRKIKVAYDQVFSPTHVDDVVKLTCFIQEKKVKGLVNLCQPTSYSRYQIAIDLSQKLHIDSNFIERISLHEIKGMENRPLNTSLRSSSLFDSMQTNLWNIDDAIHKVASNWLGKHEVNSKYSRLN